MAWFDDLELPGSTITGYFAHVAGDGPDDDNYPDVSTANGTVTLVPTARAVRHGGAWVGIRSVSGVIVEGEIWADETAELPLRVLATDADTGVENWGWTATVTIDGATLPKFTFRAPQSGVHLTGNDIIPVTGSPVEIVMPDLTDYATIEDVHAAIGEANLGLDDTGARNMSGVWTGSGAPSWNSAILRRIGPIVSLTYTGVPGAEGPGGSWPLPNGFSAPVGVITAMQAASTGEVLPVASLVLTNSSTSSSYLIFNGTDTSTFHVGSTTWITTDPWPETLPGTPA